MEKMKEQGTASLTVLLASLLPLARNLNAYLWLQGSSIQDTTWAQYKLRSRGQSSTSIYLNNTPISKKEYLVSKFKAKPSSVPQEPPSLIETQSQRSSHHRASWAVAWPTWATATRAWCKKQKKTKLSHLKSAPLAWTDRIILFEIKPQKIL